MGSRAGFLVPWQEITFSDLAFDPAVREMCVTPKFQCPHYGHSWACPPAAPHGEEMLQEFRQFFLVYFCVDLDAYITKQRQNNSRRQAKRTDQQLRDQVLRGSTLIEGYQTEIDHFLAEHPVPPEKRLVFGAGGSCQVCNNPGDDGCTYDDGEPCRYPDRQQLSLEAVGIHVGETIAKIGLTLEWPPVHQAYRVGLVAFK